MMNTLKKSRLCMVLMLLCLNLVSEYLLGQEKTYYKIKSNNSNTGDVFFNTGDYFGVEQNGKWGVCDMDGDEIISPKYDGLTAIMIGDCFGVEQNGKWGICNKNGNEIIAPKYDGLSPNMIGDCFGVIQDGKVVFQPVCPKSVDFMDAVQS